MTKNKTIVDANNMELREVFLNKIEEVDEEPKDFFSLTTKFLNKLFGDY